MRSPLLRLAAFAARILPAGWRASLYRLGPLTRWIRAALTRAGSGGPKEIRVAGGDLAGARLVLDLGTQKALWLGTYELDLQRAIRTFAAPGMTAYDVGANLGYTALLLARAVGPEGRVMAFEPEPRNLRRLALNLALNPEGRRVTVLAAAVGARTGRAHLQIHRSPSKARLVGASGRRESFEADLSVPLVALDQLRARGARAPQLVKIDVEGAEAMVLTGMQRMLDRDRPLLLIELHGPEAAQDVRRKLEGHDYDVLNMDGRYTPAAPRSRRHGNTYAVAIPRAVRPRRGR